MKVEGKGCGTPKVWTDKKLYALLARRYSGEKVADIAESLGLSPSRVRLLITKAANKQASKALNDKEKEQWQTLIQIYSAPWAVVGSVQFGLPRRTINVLRENNILTIGALMAAYSGEETVVLKNAGERVLMDVTMLMRRLKCELK